MERWTKDKLLEAQRVSSVPFAVKRKDGKFQDFNRHWLIKHDPPQTYEVDVKPHEVLIIEPFHLKFTVAP